MTSAGVATTLSNSPVVSVYKDNGTTESTAGVTLTADFDARTGLNHVRITTASDTSFYSGGSDFQCVITTGQIAGTNVIGYVVGHFTIHNRSQSEAVYYGSITGASPTTTALIDTGLTQADTNFWNNRVVVFLTGTLKWQATNITGFTPGTDTLTYAAVTTAPAQNDRYIIV
jgi:hypothetical protein